MRGYFRELYRWKKEHTNFVMAIWRAKMIDRVRDSLYKLKQVVQKRKKVLWCDDEIEEALKVLWKSKQLLDRLQRAQEKRSIEEAKDSQGSVSTVSVVFKMEKELKRKAKKIEVFEKIYMKKGGEPGEVVCCDGRSNETTAQYFVLEKVLIDRMFAETQPGMKSIKEEISDVRVKRTSRRLRTRKDVSVVLGPPAPCFTRRTQSP